MSLAPCKPSPICLDDFWSKEALRLKAASLSGLVGQFAGLPDVVALHAGLPPPASFPVSGFHMDLQQPSTPADGPTAPTSIHITSPDAVIAAQQYCFSAGYPPLLDWVNSTMKAAHAPPVPCASAITSGAVHALSLATSLLVNPGEWVLMDEVTYSHALEVVYIPKGVRPLPVRMDEHGMDPAHLAHQVCRQHNLMILEDDAYWWLYWGSPQRPVAPGRADTDQPATSTSGHLATVATPSRTPWHSHLPVSFLSMDVDGRVLRVDTLAKVLGPGYRVGWVTGAPQLVDKIALAAQGSCVGACPLGQVLVSQLLVGWGEAGWHSHLQRLTQLYKSKAHALEAAVSRHLTGLATWAAVPSAGMFMWLKLVGRDGGSPPPAEAQHLAAALLDARVVAVPGDLCKACKELPPHLRLTFAFLDEAMLEDGVKRLATALRSVRAMAGPAHEESV